MALDDDIRRGPALTQLTHILTDLVAVTLLAALYFHRHRRRDLVAAFVGVNVGLSQAWNATVTTAGQTTTARNVAWNGTLAASASTTFGYLGTTPGTAGVNPTLTCTAT